jgi:hypothetical protein
MLKRFSREYGSVRTTAAAENPKKVLLEKIPNPRFPPPADPSLQDRHFYFGKLLCRIFCREQPGIACLTLIFSTIRKLH